MANTLNSIPKPEGFCKAGSLMVNALSRCEITVSSPARDPSRAKMVSGLLDARRSSPTSFFATSVGVDAETDAGRCWVSIRGPPRQVLQKYTSVGGTDVSASGDCTTSGGRPAPTTYELRTLNLDRKKTNVSFYTSL